MNIEKIREDESRKAFEKYRDERNALLESEGHRPGSKWHVTNAHYPTWEQSRAAIEISIGEMADETVCPLSVEAYWIKQIESHGLKVTK